jgi:copper transport protein
VGATDYRLIVDPLRRARRLLIACCAIALGVLTMSGPAAAQDGSNSLAASNPADGATLGTSPAIMTFTFNQPIGTDEAFTVAVGCGTPAQPQSTGIPQLAEDDVTFNVEVLSPFPKGACTITWLLRDELDQPIATDLIAFSVAADTPTASTGGSTASTVPVAATNSTVSIGSDVEAVGSTGGAVWLGGLISGSAVLIFLGATLLILLAWPEGTTYLLTQRFMIAVWAVAIAGTVIYVMALTADLTDNSFGSSLSPVAWFELFSTGWPGRAAVVRLAAVVGLGWVAFRPENICDEISKPIAVGLPMAAVATLAFSRMQGNLVLLGLIVNLAHVFAVAVWLGGAVLVSRVVLAGAGRVDLVDAVRGFSRLSGPAILVVILTGVAETIRLVGGALLTSSYGQVLVLKILTVVAMLLVTVKARAVVGARLARADHLSARHANRFRRTFGAEATLGIVVLAFSGWLLSINPPKVSLIPDREYALVIPMADEATGFVAEVSLDPGRVGLNAIEVEVIETPSSIVDLVLEFDPAVGSYGRGTVQDIPLSGRGVARLDLADGLPFDVATDWTVTLTAVFETGLNSRLISPLVILTEDGSVATTTTTIVFSTTIVPADGSTDTTTTSTTIDPTEVTTAPVVTVG